MKPLPFLLVPVLCAACDGASPGFAGLPERTVQIGQSSFVVRFSEDRAEAVRTNTEASFSLAAVAPRAIAAIEQASGCAVVPGTIQGDAAMVRAALQCG